MDTRDPSFRQNDSPAVLPITTPEPNNPLTSQDIPGPLTQTPSLSAEQFHLVDQNGQPVQYELQSLGDSQMMIVASPSENGQVLHVIPSTQTGMGQVIIPQGQLMDANSPQDISEEKANDGRVLRMDALADSTSSYVLHPHASLTLPRKSVTRMLEEPLLAPLQPLSSNTPIWACRLRSCEGLPLQPRFTSPDESPAVLSVDNQRSSSPSRLLDSVESTSVDNNSLLRGQSPSHPTDTCLTQKNSTVSTGGNLQGPEQNLVAVDQLMEVGDVEDTGNLDGSMHQILLGDVHTVPIQIIDNHPALSRNWNYQYFHKAHRPVAEARKIHAHEMKDLCHQAEVSTLEPGSDTQSSPDESSSHSQ
ncbi:Amyotrophic lateral sclerosis 2 chromosomal region candidate gene 8 protein like protein [Fukomys damarensis]|uniref:Amyotrophic lateral sclerosis 2 chromosomal region candidate gene 8 protein like protein n=1 Tax=Fukomys damarensis TaxID=885580 RepID=A0A091CIS2_FUKDA|nr:Amyotrophic lateral sclerosis 2 chromosomal region candidate gene 8 protein like protein [Fukomys damarensis]